MMDLREFRALGSRKSSMGRINPLFPAAVQCKPQTGPQHSHLRWAPLINIQIYAEWGPLGLSCEVIDCSQNELLVTKTLSGPSGC